MGSEDDVHLNGPATSASCRRGADPAPAVRRRPCGADLVRWWLVAGAACLAATAEAAPLRAGVGRVEITDRERGPVNDPSFVKALVLSDGTTTAALITVDVVAIGTIGLPDGFLPRVRAELARDPGIPPEHVIVNASHCHSRVRADTHELAVRAVREAWVGSVPVRVGAGGGREDRISENRRLRMKDGSVVDLRRAYASPPDDDVAAVGPIDPEVTILRVDREDGRPLAVVYAFACHPIMNHPRRGNSADFPFFASRTVEESLGDGATALFVQACGGDINPVRYKELGAPPDAEPLGTLLGATVLAAARTIETRPAAPLAVRSETLSLPRADDYAARIAAIDREQRSLVAALQPTSIDFRTFLPLLVAQRLAPDFPSHAAQASLHEQALGRQAIAQLDAETRSLVDRYLANVRVMESLTRLNVNRQLLEKHLAETRAAGSPTIEVEVCGLRVGDFRMVTFPGELLVQTGLDVKAAAGLPHAVVAGYTNGYIYYVPQADQRANTGYAQEDCDTLVGPGWQRIFEPRAAEILRGL